MEGKGKGGKREMGWQVRRKLQIFLGKVFGKTRPDCRVSKYMGKIWENT